MTALQVQQLEVDFGTVPILREIGLCLYSGQMVGLIGPNGAGKTTLLRALAQLIPHRGSIRIDERDIDSLSRTELARHIAYLTQGHHAHWPLPAHEIVALGRLPHRQGFSARLSEYDREVIQRSMKLADCEEFAARPVNQLSGGERARVMLARALAVEAPILFCDEPIASLDPYHQLHILAMLRRHAESGAIVISVLHDLTEAGRFCHRLLLLHRGRLVADGVAAEVFTADNLAEVYQVKAIFGCHDENAYLLPWEYL